MVALSRYQHKLKWIFNFTSNHFKSIEIETFNSFFVTVFRMIHSHYNFLISKRNLRAPSSVISNSSLFFGFFQMIFDTFNSIFYCSFVFFCYLQSIIIMMKNCYIFLRMQIGQIQRPTMMRPFRKYCCYHLPNDV